MVRANYYNGIHDMERRAYTDMSYSNHEWYLKGLVDAKELLAAKVCDPWTDPFDSHVLGEFEKELMQLIKDRSGEEWDELIRRLNK